MEERGKIPAPIKHPLLRNGSRSSKTRVNEAGSGKMTKSMTGKAGNSPQLPFEKVENLQPKILLNSGHAVGAKKQTCYTVQQRANVTKFKSQKSVGAVFSLNSTKECTFCCPSQPHTTHAQHSSCFLNSNSSIAKQKPVPPRDLIMSNLGRKYGNCHLEFENLKVVNDLIYNEQTHCVSIFKDYLILDDINEFLKRFYIGSSESQVRLPKLCEFYEKYSQVFPNFVSLPESKYMFRNIQRKQRLIDEQFNRKQKNEGANGDSLLKDRASLVHSANKLFSTGFIESVLNQKNCTADLGDDCSGQKREAQEQKYLASARRLYKGQRERPDSMPFQLENLDMLVQKFLNKDTESTIRLNSSLGQFGDEILGDTFQKEESRRQSIATTNSEAHKIEIGVINRQSDTTLNPSLGNRVSVISGNTASFQASKVSVPGTTASKKHGNSTVSSKIGGQPKTAAQQLKTSSKKSKTGNSAASQRKSIGGRNGAVAQQSLMQQQQLQKSATTNLTVKQKVNLLAATQQIQQQQQPVQTGTQNRLSRTGKQIQTIGKLGLNNNQGKQAVHNEEQKFLRNKYLECDLGASEVVKDFDQSPTIGEPINAKRKSANIESGSQSPVEGVMNPLSSQPHLSKTSMNQKATQPGSTLEFFKQRSSDICIGSATPTQHLYHSKQTSFKATNKILPQLNLIQQQVEQDYYSSGLKTNLAPKGQFFRSQTAMNSVQSSNRPTLMAPQPSKTKHVSRERSPPLMQQTQQIRKGKKSPHQKKDRRALPSGDNQLSVVNNNYNTGKTSVTSLGTIGKDSSAKPGNQPKNSPIKQVGNSKYTPKSLAMTGPVYLKALGTVPLSSQGSQDGGNAAPQHKSVRNIKFYSQTEINEADEDYPEDEVADEIPDEHDDTEDEEQNILKSDDEGHVNESQEASESVHGRLRPVDMLPTHGGAFQQEEDSYHMQLITGGKVRAQTSMNYDPTGGAAGGKRQLSGQNNYDPTLLLTHQSVQQRPKFGQVALTTLSHYGSEGMQKPSTVDQLGVITKQNDFNSTQQPGLNLRGLQTQIDLRPTDPSLTSGQIQFKPKYQLPSTTSHQALANRPNTNILGRQSMSMKSKFSRENSVSSRQETLQTNGATSHNKNKPQVKVQEKQKFFEASMKLGEKALVNAQGSGFHKSLASSLRQSLEPNAKHAFQMHPKPPQSLTTSNQVSVSGTRQPKTTKNNNSSVTHQSKKQNGGGGQYKTDLTTRLASNLMTQHLKKKNGTELSSGRLSFNQQHQSSQHQYHHGSSKMPQTATTTQQQQHLLPIGNSKTTSGSNTGKAQHHGSSILKQTAQDGKQRRSNAQRGGVNISSQQSKPQQITTDWKRSKGVLTSQSPPVISHANSTKQQQQSGHHPYQSSEILVGFKAMGSGKASYLTNVGSMATSPLSNAHNNEKTHNNQKTSSSRNFTSPYASSNLPQQNGSNNNRLIAKDASGQSLPKTKNLSKSPPFSSKDSLMMVQQQQQRNLLKTSNQNLSLQQQLQQINKQLALTQIKPSSFRQQHNSGSVNAGTATNTMAGVSPSQSSNSISKKTGRHSAAMLSSVISPAASHTGSMVVASNNTGEKTSKHRKSNDKTSFGTEITSTKSLQRQQNQNSKQQQQQVMSIQALISLPAPKNQQKNLQSQILRALGTTSTKNSESNNKPGKLPISTSKQKSGSGGGQFLGRSGQSKTNSAISPASQFQKSKVKQETIVTSERSFKSSLGVNPVSSVQINIFQQSTGELRSSREQITIQTNNNNTTTTTTKGISQPNSTRMASKKQSVNGGMTKQLKKGSKKSEGGTTSNTNTRHRLGGAPVTVSLSPPAHPQHLQNNRKY